MIENTNDRIAKFKKTFPIGSIHTIIDDVRKRGTTLYKGTPVVVEEVGDGFLVVKDYKENKHEVFVNYPSQINETKRTKLTKLEQFLIKHEIFLRSSLFSVLICILFALGLIGFLISGFWIVSLATETSSNALPTILVFLFALCGAFMASSASLLALAKDRRITNAKELKILLEKQNSD